MAQNFCHTLIGEELRPSQFSRLRSKHHYIVSVALGISYSLTGAETFLDVLTSHVEILD